MPNGSTTKFTEAIAAISRAVVDAAIRQYVAAALELKIDELRNLRHQHQRDPEKASDRHRPARGRLPFEWRWATRPRRPIGTLRGLVARQLLRIRPATGDVPARRTGHRRRGACHPPRRRRPG